MTMTEIGIGIALMRDNSASLETIASEFSEYYRSPVLPADLAVCHRRMIERHLIEPHPVDATLTIVTRRGELVLFGAFRGLVRFIDEGHHRFEVSLIWSLATRKAPDDDED